tara:strand:- start:3059 stop:4129 length:1071 start_codon:yes stop_codon:yes gene_type:complete
MQVDFGLFEKNTKESFMLKVLSSYGIGCDDILVEQNLNVDIYSIKLSLGCRASRMDNILVDIGMQIKSYSEPIGFASTSDGVYKISAQKKQIKSLPISEILLNSFNVDNFSCPITIGVGADEEPIFLDMAKMPNMLIGGIPGSGKSMLLHSIILSCMYNNSSLYLCDPKMVEFSRYKKHSSIKSISYSVDDFRIICSSLIKEMNDRYRTISSKGLSNFNEYNNLANKSGIFGPKPIAPCVAIIDEWADIYFEDKGIESMVCTIAQKGRAAGIFIVMATQRPSSKVVSGLVKASFPARVALRTSTAVDSRVIIEQAGAEKMTDPGTGLYKDAYSFSPSIFRTPIVTDSCINKVLGRI